MSFQSCFNIDMTLSQRCFNVASVSVKAILKPIWLVKNMDLWKIDVLFKLMRKYFLQYITYITIKKSLNL